MGLGNPISQSTGKVGLNCMIECENQVYYIKIYVNITFLTTIWGSGGNKI